MYLKNCIIKIVGAAVLLSLLFSTVAGVTTSMLHRSEEATLSIIPSEDVTVPAFTHTVLAEFGTTTGCPYCPYGHAALEQIYEDPGYSIYYISMVDNKNTHAAARNNEYNHNGWPSVFFDGGYQVRVGVYTSIPQTVNYYKSAINSCGNRAVPDIMAEVSADWLGSATMNITVSVQNNETNKYNGHLHVYVTEMVSSMGWNDAWGNAYTFAFLDYAFNEDISIDAESTWQSSTIWNGNTHNDGHGHTFGGISQDNIMVIVAVFNEEWHQGYADPPGGNPFDAYYLDESAATTLTEAYQGTMQVENTSGPIGATQQSIYVNGTWITELAGYEMAMYYNATTLEIIDVNLEDTVADYLGTEWIIYWSYNDTVTPAYVLASAVTWGTDYIPIGTGNIFKLVVNISEDAPPGDTILDLENEVGPLPSYCSYSDPIGGVIFPELIDGILNITAYICGDCNNDGIIDVADVVYLINYLFRSGAPPIPIECVGDCNNDDSVDVADVVFLINYLFRSGAAPQGCC
jgi:thiol-disulfide isomerase/thioredoxin